MTIDTTSWFTIEVNGTPVREGVYETTALGIPGASHSVIQHGFRHWNGDHGDLAWGDLAATPQAALVLKDHRALIPFTVRHWRGTTSASI